jgi:methylmalonyl-CoA mutase N-terminal domain/subunit
MAVIESMGGSVEAIESGYMQEQIARSAYAYQRAIENREKIIVGVNKFQSEQIDHIPLLKIDNSIQVQQAEKLKQFRAQRDTKAVEDCLANISKAAQEGSNLMPVVVEAVEMRCTLGEISDVLRSIFGEYK